MIQTFEKKLTLLPCAVNAARKLGPAEALGLFQDIATEHSKLIGVDYDTIKEKSNTFWAITRTRLHFFREPVLFENTTLRSWPNAPVSLACIRNYSISGEDGALAVTCATEWVMLDINTRRLRRFDSTCYPMDSKHESKTLFNVPFHRFHCSFEPTELVYSHIVRASDTDMSGHTNNTVYCRLMLDVFPADFFCQNTITDFEVRFSTESKEGDRLDIFKRQDGKTFYLAVQNSASRIIVTAAMNIA